MLGLAKYPGGKQRVAQRILRCLPVGFTAYVEPFCGNSPFLQPQYRHYLDPARKAIWLNDLCIDVANVLSSLKCNPDDFIADILRRKDCCRTVEEVRRQFEQAKAYWITHEDPAAYLFLRRLAVAHIVLRKRPSRCSLSTVYRRINRSGSPVGLSSLDADRLQVAAGIAQQVDTVTNLDFREVLSSLPENCAVYLDPPYWTSRCVDWYDHSFSQQDHVDLAAILRSLDPSRHRFLMTIEISELSRSLYILPDCFVWDTLPVYYSTPRNGSKRVKELLVANYAF